MLRLDVCSQKSAVKRLWWARREEEEEEEEEGDGGRAWERGGKKRAKRKSLILQSSEFTQSHSTATHPPVSIPHFFPSSSPPFFFFLFVASHLLSLRPSSLTAHFFLSHTQTHLSSQPHTPAAIRQDSASASISRVVSIWHQASRPPRHSPVPPHPALLVTWDNWGGNRKKRKKKGGGGREKKVWVSLWAAHRSWEDVLKLLLKEEWGAEERDLGVGIRLTPRLMFLQVGNRIGNVNPHSPPLPWPPQSRLCEEKWPSQHSVRRLPEGGSVSNSV